MTRSTSTNFTGGNSFTKADAAADPFLRSDIQQLAAAVDAHNHTTGKGLAVSGGGGGGAKVLLNYVASTDLRTVSDGHPAANAWVDIGANQSFTVDLSPALVCVEIGGCILAGGAASAEHQSATQAIIDSAGANTAYRLGGGWNTSTAGGTYTNCLAGAAPLELTGLSVGTHTVKVQASTDSALQYILCRPSSVAQYEALIIRVIQQPLG